MIPSKTIIMKMVYTLITLTLTCMVGTCVFLCEYTSHAYILPYCLCVKNECVHSRFLNTMAKAALNLMFTTRLETKRANSLNCPFHSKSVSFCSFSCYHYTCIYKFSRCSLAELCIAK